MTIKQMIFLTMCSLSLSNIALPNITLNTKKIKILKRRMRPIKDSDSFFYGTLVYPTVYHSGYEFTNPATKEKERKDFAQDLNVKSYNMITCTFNDSQTYFQSH